MKKTILALFAFLSLFSVAIPQELIDAPKPIKYGIIKFEADWCGPCKSLTNVFNLQEVQAELEKFDFYIVDIDTDKKLPTIYHVSQIPCVVMFEYLPDDKAKEIKRFVGSRNKDFVLQWLKNF